MVRIIAAILLLVIASPSSFGQHMESFKAFKWENRLLLLFSPASENSRFQEQLREVEKYAEAARERDLLLFSFPGISGSKQHGLQLSEEELQALREQLNIELADFCLVLIGKDGGVKLRKTVFTPFQEVMMLIDSMPMRKQEIRERNH